MRQHHIIYLTATDLLHGQPAAQSLPMFLFDCSLCFSEDCFLFQILFLKMNFYQPMKFILYWWTSQLQYIVWLAKGSSLLLISICFTKSTVRLIFSVLFWIFEISVYQWNISSLSNASPLDVTPSKILLKGITMGLGCMWNSSSHFRISRLAAPLLHFKYSFVLMHTLRRQ